MAKVGGAILRSRVARQPAVVSVEVTVDIRAEYCERDEWSSDGPVAGNGKAKKSQTGAPLRSLAAQTPLARCVQC